MSLSRDHRPRGLSCSSTNLAEWSRGAFGSAVGNGAEGQGEREGQPTPLSAEEPSLTGTDAQPCVTEIVLTCSPQILAGMVAAYQTAIEDAGGDLPLQILWWGQSRKYGHGSIVLEWSGKVSEAFLHDLVIDEEVFDYLIYEDDRVFFEVQQPEAGAQESKNVEPLPVSERRADQ